MEEKGGKERARGNGRLGEGRGKGLEGKMREREEGRVEE